jgi:hypothetical protein
MLKVQRSGEGRLVVFTLSGRIEAIRVAELEKLLESEAEGLGIVLDLKELKLVDREAVWFLARCEAQGIKLENCPAYIREWLGALSGEKS